MANSLSELMRQVSFYEAGGKDPGNTNADAFAKGFGMVKGVGDAYLGTIKQVLENKKLQQDARSKEIENTPIVETLGNKAIQSTLDASRQDVPQPEGGFKSFEAFQKSIMDQRQAGIDDATGIAKGLQEQYGQFTPGQYKEFQQGEAAGNIYYVDPKDPSKVSAVPLPGYVSTKAFKDIRKPTQRPYQGQMWAIGDNFYTRAFISKLKPDLKEGEDIPKAEADRLHSEFVARFAKDAPKNIPPETLTKIAGYRSAADLNTTIKNQYMELAKAGNAPVGAITGRWSDLKQGFGLLNSQQQAEFMANVANAFNDYLNRLSGAAISEQEAQRLLRAIASVKNNPGQFLGTLDSVQADIARDLSSLVQTAKDANYRVADLEKFIQAPALPKTEPAPAPGMQKTQTPKLSPEDQAALEWARKNPKDGRAQKILQLNGGK